MDQATEQLNAIKLSPKEWTNATCDNLQQMNDDCLLDIFAINFSDPIDLCPIAETCTRFRQVTQSMVPKHINIQAVHNSTRYYVKFKTSSWKTENDVRRIFKNFGSNLSTIVVRGTEGEATDNFLWNLIKKHCDDDNLRSLTIQQMTIKDVLSIKSKPIFTQLQTLHLYSSIASDATIFSELDSLVELKVEWGKNFGGILKNTFPKLERFEGENVVDEQILESLSTFTSRHKQLKKIRIGIICNSQYRTNILQSITNNCKELEDLHLFDVGSDLRPLQALKSLTDLGLSKASLTDLRFFSNLKELRQLSLMRCKLPKNPSQFAYWAQLTKLKLMLCGDGEPIDVVGIISRLTNLEVFEILFDFKLDQRTFSKIESVVKGRPNVLILECLSTLRWELNFDHSVKTGQVTWKPLRLS